MSSLKLSLGLLCLCLLQGCASLRTDPGAHYSTATSQSAECPPLFGKVCYGPTDRPDVMRCGCSSVSPLGTPYP
jgi:hypothetical protein